MTGLEGVCNRAIHHFQHIPNDMDGVDYRYTLFGIFARKAHLLERNIGKGISTNLVRRLLHHQLLPMKVRGELNSTTFHTKILPSLVDKPSSHPTVFPKGSLRGHRAPEAISKTADWRVLRPLWRPAMTCWRQFLQMLKQSVRWLDRPLVRRLVIERRGDSFAANGSEATTIESYPK